MIIIKYCGGLGNQMFQNALQFVLENRYPGITIKADTRHYWMLEEHNGFEIEDIFDISLTHASTQEIKSMNPQFVPTPALQKLPYGIRYKIAHDWQHKYNFIKRILCKSRRMKLIGGYCHNCYNDLVLYLDTSKDWYLDGMWQNVRYYKGFEDQVRQHFKFKKEITDSVDLAVLEDIHKSKSVSVHVRRGDFVNSQFDICKKEYYLAAMKVIQDKIGEDVKYFFFSDDAEFVKKEFSFIENKEIVVHDKTCSYIDMMMISHCKHNITSNSTFSFWGAFLGCPENRVVVAPAFSIRDRRGSYEMSVPDNWTQIKV